MSSAWPQQSLQVAHGSNRTLAANSPLFLLYRNRYTNPRTARQFLGTIFLLFLQHYGGAVVVESGLGDLAACVPFELDGHAALIFHVKGRAAPRK
jgi:hypothetical protein